MVSLRPISESNREAVEALRVSPGQEQFVSSVADSMLEAAEEPGGRALYWAVYADETPVGFVMISDEVAPGTRITYRTTSGSCSSTSATNDKASAPRHSISSSNTSGAGPESRC